MMTETKSDPRTYGGMQYSTTQEALEAAWYGYLTAGGSNTTEEALEYAADGLEENLVDAATDGWTWPGEPTEEDHRAALECTVASLKAETRADVSEEAIRELCILTTRDGAGRHFAEYSDHWQALEDAGLILVHRPVHDVTGTPYSQEHWSLEVTEAGQDLVDSSEELHPEVG